MAETTYYQSRHTGEEIDNLLDESIAATKAANEAAENANTAVEDIPAMFAGKADLDPDTGYVKPSQISPSGSPMHDSFVSRGAVWNDSTKKWELNGLTDITTQQMVDIYNIFIPENMAGGSSGASVFIPARTNFPFFPSSRWDYMPNLLTMSWNTHIEIIQLSRGNSSIQPQVRLGGSNNFGFNYFTKLKKITDIIYIDSFSGNISFTGCTTLEYLRISNLNRNIDLRDCIQLSLDSVSYLVENAINTSEITVTVNAEIYDKLTNPSNQDWYAVNELAITKQISFATT